MPLKRAESLDLIQEVDHWVLEGDKKIEKTFQFKDFNAALSFINEVGKVAEAEGHHPDMSLFNYSKVKVELSTHAINGLSENDFILAAKVDELLR